MDVTPNQLIDEVEFREVRRGADPAEVDAVLDRVAAAMAKLHQQVTEATERAQAAEAKLAQAAPAPPAPAEAPARSIRPAPSSSSAPWCWPSAPPTPR